MRLTILINKIHDGIKFTIEIENGHKVNYLDLTIIKQNVTLEFDISRKSTPTNHVTLFKSDIYSQPPIVISIVC